MTILDFFSAALRRPGSSAFSTIGASRDAVLAAGGVSGRPSKRARPRGDQTTYRGIYETAVLDAFQDMEMDERLTTLDVLRVRSDIDGLPKYHLVLIANERALVSASRMSEFQRAFARRLAALSPEAANALLGVSWSLCDELMVEDDFPNTDILYRFDNEPATQHSHLRTTDFGDL